MSSRRRARRVAGCWVAYTFFKEVKPGPHAVEVFFAGCCSASPPQPPAAFAGSPVLAVHYR